ncbi:MAG: fimbrillin family protein [Bacteroidales bacterium]|nr:fimbrillin family protein [Bacteroidales bacterium]
MLATALAGCQRLSVPEGELIRFGAEEQLVVKSDFMAPHDATYLNTSGNEACVYGTWSQTPSSQIDTVFDGVILTCGGTASSWTYDAQYSQNWRKEGIYNFKAVFPIPDEIEHTTSGTHLTVPYSMHTHNYDLMAASARRDMSEGYMGTVVLPFRHATAAVRFLFRKGEDVSENYSLVFFELQNLRTVGELILETDELTSDSWYSASRTEYIYRWEAASDSDGKALPTTYGAYTGYTWYYCIPQSLTVSEDEEHPAVHFRVRMSNGITMENTLQIPENDTNGDPISWEPGKVYTYYIGVTPQTTTVRVGVSKWDAAYVSVDELVFS